MIEKEIAQYIKDHTTSEDKVMYELNRATHLRTFYPNMLSGSVQGKFLEMVSCMIRPRRILEIGTFTGYSAICLAKGLTPDGKLITIEVNEEMEDFINDFIKKSGMEDRIELVLGDALKVIPALDEQFDLIFIDADKEQYIDYYELALDKLKNGAFILADNVLWGGKAVYDKKPDRKSTRLNSSHTDISRMPSSA